MLEPADGVAHAEWNSALMTEGLGLLMLTELPRTLGQGFHGQQLTILRLGDRRTLISINICEVWPKSI